MSRLPIRVRVAAAFALAMAAVLAATGLYLYARLSSHLTSALDRDLRLRAQDLAALVARPGSSLRGTGAGRLVERGESYAQLLSPTGRVLDATSPLGRTPLLSAPQLREAQGHTIYAEPAEVPGLNEPSRLLATRVGGDVLVVGATLQDNADTLASFRTELLIAGPLALLLASGVGYVLAGLSLAQVESMRRRAAAISAQTAGERLPVPPTGDELERLAETLNQMLERLESALERERAFVADAAHELRTPLALVRAELELALRQADSPDELREAVLRSSEEVERLTQLAEALLLIARADGGRLPLQLEQLDAAELLAAVRSRVEWRVEQEGKRVEVAEVAGLGLVGDRLRLEQALTNLVDNALRYGGPRIELVGERVDGELRLHVRDDGPGFPPEFRARAFERFARADAARARGGVGLGLAIVRPIAEGHGGSAHIAHGGPGADVWLTVPAGG
jgi:two-component system OmpR family sensor kinase